MAIEKTIFTGTDGPALAAELAAWLQVNAADYFDSIELDENGYQIVCKIDDVTVMNLSFSHGTSSAAFNFYLLNSLNAHPYSGTDINIAYKTTKSILLVGLSNENTQSLTDPATGESFMAYARTNYIHIAKSNAGNTSFIIKGPGSSTSGTGNYWTADVAADSRWATSINDSFFFRSLVSKRPLTVTCPVPLSDGGTVAEGIYFTPFTQYKGINEPVIINADGKKYLYDGTYAMEE